MWLQWAAKELFITNAVKYMSSSDLEISHVQPPQTQLVLGILQTIASGMLLYIISVIMFSTTVALTCKALNISSTVITKVWVRQAR